MKLVFTKNNLPLSLLIRCGLKEPVSHMAYVFDDKLVFHSNLIGVHIDWYDNFKKKNTIVNQIELNQGLQFEEDVYQRAIGMNVGQPYDFIALFYFIFRAFMYRFFNVPMPTKSNTEIKKAFLCTELAYALPKSYTQALLKKDLAITSPHEVYVAIKGALNV
jgi:hypothetical protein